MHAEIEYNVANGHKYRNDNGVLNAWLLIRYITIISWLYYEVNVTKSFVIWNLSQKEHKDVAITSIRNIFQITGRE